MERVALIMERFWLVLGVLSALGVAYYVAAYGWEASKVFIWFPAVALAMFWYRRFMRKRMAGWAARRQQEEQAAHKP